MHRTVLRLKADGTVVRCTAEDHVDPTAVDEDDATAVRWMHFRSGGVGFPLLPVAANAPPLDDGRTFSVWVGIDRLHHSAATRLDRRDSKSTPLQTFDTLLAAVGVNTQSAQKCFAHCLAICDFVRREAPDAFAASAVFRLVEGAERGARSGRKPSVSSHVAARCLRKLQEPEGAARRVREELLKRSSSA